jgi:hypothetical protein
VHGDLPHELEYRTVQENKDDNGVAARTMGGLRFNSIGIDVLPAYCNTTMMICFRPALAG